MAGSVERPASATEQVRYETNDHVAVVTLNRPDVQNRLSVEVLSRLLECSHRAQEDPNVRAVVVTGAGDRAFSTGGDLRELMHEVKDSDGLDVIVPDPSKRFFSDLFKPVIAAVNGSCIAGGFEIMLGTDLRVASRRAVFGLAEVRWGQIPGGGSHVRLPAQVPWAIAMQMILTAEPIAAERAYEVGLVNEVVEPGTELERALELGRLIAGNAPLAVQTAKEIAVRALAQEAGFQLERGLNERVVRSDDAREGLRAFAEKRTPRYRAR